MVCDRCIAAVRAELIKLHLTPLQITLGEALISEETPGEEVISALDKVLLKLGFERIDDPKILLVEKVKTIVVETIHHTSEETQRHNWSDIIAKQVHYDYKYLSKLFSSEEGITIENFIIRQKIEKVKELIRKGELTFSEIAWRLGYSSAAHLSSQFKKVTGMTPSEFKKPEHS